VTDRKPYTPARIDLSAHIGLAHLACRSFRSHVGRGFDYDDLVQAACEGLLYAAASFDPEQGKFSTYAVPMAKKFVKRLVATQARTVKCPEYTQDRVAAQGRPEKKTAPQAPRERRTTGGPFDWGSAPAPTRRESLRVTQLGYQGVPSTWGAARPEPGKPVHSPGAELSLDYSGADSGDSTMHDYLAPAEGQTPESLAAAREVSSANARLWAAMSCLNDNQIAVVVGRLDGRSGPDIARQLGVSKERVRQIQEEATGILKNTLAPKPNLN
jgi:RNA polymerase sigma factor (sigma-70 family)